MKDSNNITQFSVYKGYPLVRKNKTIYYGNMYNECVVMIQIMHTKKVGDVEIADKVKVFRMLTDDKLSANEKITKTADKDSLYEALDIASIWLSRIDG